MEGNAGDMASGEAEGDEQRRGRQEGADAARATSRESVSTHTDKHTREMRVNAQYWVQYWVEMGGVVCFRAQCAHHPSPYIVILITCHICAIIPSRAGSRPSVTWFPHPLTEVSSPIGDRYRYRTPAIKRRRLAVFPNHAR